MRRDKPETQEYMWHFTALISTKNRPVAAGWNRHLLATWIEKKRLSKMYFRPKRASTKCSYLWDLVRGRCIADNRAWISTAIHAGGSWLDGWIRIWSARGLLYSLRILLVLLTQCAFTLCTNVNGIHAFFEKSDSTARRSISNRCCGLTRPEERYGVAFDIRIDKIISLFCKGAL